VRPITTASSPSWSKRRSQYGSTIVPPDPTSDDGAFRKTPWRRTSVTCAISAAWSR
jgi:hypothetical protein